MKICILAVCLFGLALAAPGGDRPGRPGGKGKGGPRGPIGGLVRLCISLAEDADEKREFDYENALVDICTFILSQRPDDSSSDDDDDDEGTTDAPTSGPTSAPTNAPTSGPTSAPTDAPTSGPIDPIVMRRGKGVRQGAGRDSEGDGEGKDIVGVLLHICRGLAEMAEEAEVEARAIETKEDLMEAMKVVCNAAKAEADARDSTTPAL